jgi:hypothetical protein
MGAFAKSRDVMEAEPPEPVPPAGNVGKKSFPFRKRRRASAGQPGRGVRVQQVGQPALVVVVAVKSS